MTTKQDFTPTESRGRFRSGSGRSPAGKLITETPRYAKNVSATLAMIARSDG
jgi:hypothetical protein